MTLNFIIQSVSVVGWEQSAFTASESSSDHQIQIGYVKFNPAAPIAGFPNLDFSVQAVPISEFGEASKIYTSMCPYIYTLSYLIYILLTIHKNKYLNSMA